MNNINKDSVMDIELLVADEGRKAYRRGYEDAHVMLNIKKMALDYALEVLKVTRDKGYSLTQIAKPIETFLKKNPSTPDNE